VEIRWMRAFSAVAEELNFGSAARSLHIAQPAVSQQVAQLERSLGVTLFDRTTRSVSLTAAGQAFLDPCHTALDAADAAARAAQNSASGEVGRIRVGFSGAFANKGVSLLARAIRSDYPLLNLFIAGSAKNEFVLGQLIAHKLDVGIISATYGHPKVGRRLVAADRLGAFVPIHHALAGKYDVALADLRDEPFILTDTSGGLVLRDLTLQVCRDAGFQPNVIQEATDFYTVFALVAAGLGLSIVPESAQAVRPADVAYVPLAGIEQRLESIIAWPLDHVFPTLHTVLRVAESVLPTPASRDS
jgi:DNA-binding transcriptional LysR family regulator